MATKSWMSFHGIFTLPVISSSLIPFITTQFIFTGLYPYSKAISIARLCGEHSNGKNIYLTCSYPFLRVIMANLFASRVSKLIFNKFRPALCSAGSFLGRRIPVLLSKEAGRWKHTVCSHSERFKTRNFPYAFCYLFYIFSNLEILFSSSRKGYSWFATS